VGEVKRKKTEATKWGDLQKALRTPGSRRKGKQKVENPILIVPPPCQITEKALCPPKQKGRGVLTRRRGK